MSRLKKEEQDLILDFYFRCGDEVSINEGRDLIAANPEAAMLYDNLESTLKELDAVKYEPCPDNLVEVTIARLKQAASQVAHDPLEHKESPHPFAISDLIRAEQNKPNIPFLQASSRISRYRLTQIAAIAAVFLAISGIGFPVFSNMRQSAWKTACLSNFGRLGQAITRFAGDHDGQLPSVPMTAGSPWYKIGEQGSENQSNTRHLWILIQQGYSSPEDFVCPGHRQSEAACGDSTGFSRLNDFPCHRNISYSYQLLCGKNPLETQGNSFLLADRNPLFENICSCCNPTDNTRIEGFQIRLDPRLLAQMSSNHRGQGQNILRRDGSAVFMIDRQFAGDDIYTLKGILVYRGSEIPCMDGKDTFLVP